MARSFQMVEYKVAETDFFLEKKSGNKSNYTTMLTKGCKEGEQEELRNIYVGITRPRKVLFLTVPREDVAKWTEFLNIGNN